MEASLYDLSKIEFGFSCSRLEMPNNKRRRRDNDLYDSFVFIGRSHHEDDTWGERLFSLSIGILIGIIMMR